MEWEANVIFKNPTALTTRTLFSRIFILSMIARPYDTVSSTFIQNSSQFIEAFQTNKIFFGWKITFPWLKQLLLLDYIRLDKGYDFWMEQAEKACWDLATKRWYLVWKMERQISQSNYKWCHLLTLLLVLEYILQYVYSMWLFCLFSKMEVKQKCLRTKNAFWLSSFSNSANDDLCASWTGEEIWPNLLARKMSSRLTLVPSIVARGATRQQAYNRRRDRLTREGKFL